VFGYLLFNVSPTCQTTIWKTVVPQPSHNVGISRCSAHAAAAALHKDERLNCGWGADHLSARDLGGLNLSPVMTALLQGSGELRGIESCGRIRAGRAGSSVKKQAQQACLFL
jgi:hypothetical protein